jgi:hypothetical protein
MEYMSKVITWLAHKHVGVFQPPIPCPGPTIIGSGATTTGPHGGISEDGDGPSKFSGMEPQVPNNFYNIFLWLIQFLLMVLQFPDMAITILDISV